MVVLLINHLVNFRDWFFLIVKSLGMIRELIVVHIANCSVVCCAVCDVKVCVCVCVCVCEGVM